MCLARKELFILSHKRGFVFTLLTAEMRLLKLDGLFLSLSHTFTAWLLSCSHYGWLTERAMRPPSSASDRVASVDSAMIVDDIFVIQAFSAAALRDGY